MAGHMLPYHSMLGDKKLCLAFLIIPTSDIGFMFGHGSIREFLYKYFVHLFSGRSFVDTCLKNYIVHIYVYIYMAINHTIGQNFLVKGVF